MNSSLSNGSPLENLKSSPIYNLSLSSLENFHTSFLAWIGNNYPKAFLSIFLEDIPSEQAQIYFKEQVNYGKNVKVDLQIKIIDKGLEKLVIIENKLKSFPTNEQLNKYTDVIKNQNASFILLSLAPKFDLPDEWQCKNYSELYTGMRALFNSNFNYKNSYHKYLIEDYINVVGEISKRFPVLDSNKYDIYAENEMDEIGLKDIYVKYRTTELANFLQKNLQGSANVKSLFYNKKGTISISKKFENPEFEIGIQIEGNQYRYYLCALYGKEDIKSNKTREAIAEELFNKFLWFELTGNPKGARIYENFCGYAPSFIYRYQTLNNLFGKPLEEITYEEILWLVKKNFDNLETNEAKIKQIINNHLSLQEKKKGTIYG